MVVPDSITAIPDNYSVRIRRLIVPSANPEDLQRHDAEVEKIALDNRSERCCH